jgi:hypothetical protein
VTRRVPGLDRQRQPGEGGQQHVGDGVRAPLGQLGTVARADMGRVTEHVDSARSGLAQLCRDGPDQLDRSRPEPCAVSLDLGADDYVTKPFTVTDLMARVRVALQHGRYQRPDRPRPIEVGPVCIDLDAGLVTRWGQPVRCAKPPPRQSCC